MDIISKIPSELSERYEFYNYGHALEILIDAYEQEWTEIVECLTKLELTMNILPLFLASKIVFPEPINFK